MRKLLPLSCMALFMLGACQQTKPEFFEIASQETNKQCPMIIDDVTTLDSTRYQKTGNTFIYYYTLTGRADTDSTATMLGSYLQQNIPQILKSSKDMDVFRKADVTMRYVYLSEKTKQEQLNLIFTPEMYK